MAKKIIIVTIALFISVSSPADEKKSARQFGWPALPRTEFNRLAANQGVPLFWANDSNGSGTVEPNELVPVGAGGLTAPYIDDSKFTDTFRKIYSELVEAKRREVILAELNSGSSRLFRSDFRRSSLIDRTFVAHMVKVGKIIDELYKKQNGSFHYLKDIPQNDLTSLALFHRNHGPWCEAPRTEKDPFCSALISFPPRTSDAYPKGMKQDAEMCKKLKALPNGKDLLDPFKVVRRDGGRLVALPLTAVYGDKMGEVAIELTAAASDLDSSEPKLKAYLLAAAKGFETNDWLEADEAWVAMNSQNSKWYVRVAPDETQFETCQEKAGFQLSFAKIDRGSLAWQGKLNAVREEMEKTLAALIGPPYQARKLSFNFPDFIEIILNSGDARTSQGAIIGESLPNWGKVADEGRTRTVAMTNIYTDPDSMKLSREKSSALLDDESMKYFTEDKEPGLLATVLHEATHNFGPYTDYKINGKNPSAVFGGRTALTLEELKAQTGALWYVDFLKQKKLISEQKAREIYTDNVRWCFGHISQGMFTASGSPKTYSQLSAIQIGFLLQEGALAWINGLFHINFDKMPKAAEKLMQKVGRIMVSGDVAGAKAFLDEYLTGPSSKLIHAKEIEERLLKFPRATFDYSVSY